MSIVLIGDVGVVNGAFHVGDEAMVEAAVTELAARGHSNVIIVSAAPDDTAARYDRQAVGRIGFGAEVTADRPSRERRLEAVIAAANGDDAALESSDPARAVIECIAAAEAVVIAGGGNLSSLWPEHIYERAAIAAIAASFSVPLVVSGQTIGPTLSGADGVILARLLANAALVGVREQESFDTGVALGVRTTPIRRSFDDAMWLPDGNVSVELPERFCAVTIAEYPGNVEASLFRHEVAELLSSVLAATDLDIVFIPHEGTLGRQEDPSGDELVHSEIAASLPAERVTLLPMLAAGEVATVTRMASLVISSRYHPVVFATSAGVPVVGISVDDYTSVKISGALRNVGLEEFAIPSSSLASGHAQRVVEAAWSSRSDILQRHTSTSVKWMQRSAQWWDDVAAVVSGKAVSAWAPEPMLASSAFLADADRLQLQRLTSWQRSESELATARKVSLEELPPAEQETLELERKVGRAEAAYTESLLRIAKVEAQLVAARDLASSLGEPAFHDLLIRRQLASESSEAEEQLQAILSSKTFRWTHPLRLAYSRIRGLGSKSPGGGAG